MSIHEVLDFRYDGDDAFARQLDKVQDVDFLHHGESPLHVATRRRRLNAVRLLLDRGAMIDATNAHGKTAYAHAIRRGFTEVVEHLKNAGCDTTLNAADRFAVAVQSRDWNAAKAILDEDPSCVRTGNPEEDRLIADIAGYENVAALRLLIDAGADLTAKGLDHGTALHQAAWFGQPENAEVLIAAGAPIDDFDNDHRYSPLGWAVHGSRFSGGADECQPVYARLVSMLLDAGPSICYPGESDDRYLRQLHNDASEAVRTLLPDVVSQ